MTFEPVKIPSTVFNNMLVDIMKKLAQKHGFEFMKIKDIVKNYYRIVKVEEGVNVGRNPFQSHNMFIEEFIRVEEIRTDRLITYHDPIFGIEVKQFFNNEQEVTDYFKNIETVLSDRMDEILKLQAERKANL